MRRRRRAAAAAAETKAEEQPAKQETVSGTAPVAAIGGADGPTAFVAGSGPEGSRGVCSALHFEPVQDDVEWCVEFLTQPFAGADIPLL